MPASCSLCTLVEGGSDGPSVCPSVVCPLVPTPDPHARRCATRRGGVDTYTLMPRCALSSAACHCDTCQPLPRRLHAHDATDCCHVCDMMGDIPFGGPVLAGGHTWLHVAWSLPDVWRVRTPPRLRGRLHVTCRCIPVPTLALPAVPNERSVGADQYTRVIVSSLLLLFL